MASVPLPSGPNTGSNPGEGRVLKKKKNRKNFQDCHGHNFLVGLIFRSKVWLRRPGVALQWFDWSGGLWFSLPTKTCSFSSRVGMSKEEAAHPENWSPTAKVCLIKFVSTFWEIFEQKFSFASTYVKSVVEEAWPANMENKHGLDQGVLTTHRLAYLCCQCDSSLEMKLALGSVVARNEQWRYP